jgi:hypothetical protein
MEVEGPKKRGRKAIDKTSESYLKYQEAGKEFLKYYTYLSYQKKLRDTEKLQNPAITLPDIVVEYTRQKFIKEYLAGNNLYNRDFLIDKFKLKKNKVTKLGRHRIKDKDEFYKSIELKSEEELINIMKNYNDKLKDENLDLDEFKDLKIKVYQIKSKLIQIYDWYQDDITL